MQVTAMEPIHQMSRALRFCRSEFLHLDGATLWCRSRLYRTGIGVAIGKRFDTLVRGRIKSKKLSTPIHSEQPSTAPIAIRPSR